MFIRLFLKECKQILSGMTYYIVVICIVFFYITQLGNFNILQKPLPGKPEYGTMYSKDEAVIMDETIKLLFREYVYNDYGTYPIGFYKSVVLNEKKKDQMAEIMMEVAGFTKAELNQAVEKHSSNMTAYDKSALGDIKATPDLTYERFLELMRKADKLLGGGSSYSDTSLTTNARVPMSYEDALKEYNNIMEKDHLTGAYARLFSDYIGIVLAILPIFIAVTRGLRDKRAKAKEIIYSRQVSSSYIILTRYLALLTMVLLPVIIIAAIPATQCIYYGITEGISVDYFGFAKYIFGWLLPSLMIVTSLGIFFTELTDSAIAIIIQGLWWFISIFSGVVNIRGGYGWNLVPRHNELGNYEVFHENFGILAANRITYSVAAIFLIAASIWVYEMKRKGKLNIHGTIFPNRKSKSEV